MAHYALINHDNIVIQVFVGKSEDEPSPAGFGSWEQYYCPPTAKACLRTSYNTLEGIHKHGGIPFRKNYAGIGYTYDASLDAFIPPKPYPSWILDETTCTWIAPVPRTDIDSVWSEDTLSWIQLDNS